MDKHVDELHLLTVSETTAVPALDPLGLGMEEMREDEMKRGKELLREFGERARGVGVVRGIELAVGGGTHVGEVVCRYVKEHDVELLVLGRRGGMGVVGRFFLGSSSKYCVEEAECTVVVIKSPFGPEVEHEGSKEDVVAAEERERELRIREYEARSVKEGAMVEGLGEEGKMVLEAVKETLEAE